MWRVLVDRPAGFGLRSVTRVRVRSRIGVVIGLLFLGGPLADLLNEDLGPGHLAALLLGTGLFVVAYALLMPPSPWLARRGPAAMVLVLGSMPLLAVLLLVGGAPHSYAALFVYFAAATGMLLPAGPALAVIAITGAAVAVAGVVDGNDTSAVLATVLTVVAIGVMMSAFGRLARTNRELEATREDLARLAVSEERLRIARDMHDLLGHSLSVIAIKSELARKLIEREPERAAAELEEITAVTRDALAGVRDTVQGYRRMSLAHELEGAKRALSAAGIDCTLGSATAELPEDVDATLAWAVREGTTNVIRHSRAQHCAIRVDANGERAAVEIEDDGSGAGLGDPGSGLSGLRERAQRLRGELEAGARPEGGFRLRLTVPLAT